jgi:hypothetical protein
VPINFTLNSFGITNTRSVHEDTDYVCIGMSINGRILPPVAKRIGNVNNGQHQVGLTISLPNQFSSADKFVFGYLIINHGGGKTEDVLIHCQNAMTQTTLLTFSPAGAALTQVQGRNIPASFATPLRAKDTMNGFWNLIKPQFQHLSSDRCDGPVVIDQFSFLGSSMADVELVTDVNNWIYQGIDSAVGCGSNSDYGASWNAKIT